MAYSRLLPGKSSQDPFDRFDVAKLREEHSMPSAEFKEQHEQKWEPPMGARTFADYDMAAARMACQRRPHVILREDPMFGRRGYAKEVIQDPKHGYVVLVIAFVNRKDAHGNWQEPIRPKDCDRMYWDPAKVEFAAP